MQVAILARSSREKSGRQRVCLFEWTGPALSPAERDVTAGRQRIAITCTAATAVCVCVRACVRACVMCLQYTIIIFDPG